MGEFLHMCEMRFWRKIFIDPNPILEPTHSPVPGFTRDLVSISADHLGVRPRDRNWDLAVNPSFNVQNRLVNFCGHDSTQSGKYDYCLLAYNTINQEDKRRKMFPLVIAMLPVLVHIDFSHQANSLSINSGFQVFASTSPNLTSIIASV